MLKYTQQANNDLASILAGLVSFRIGNAIDPSLSQEHAESIFQDIVFAFKMIPSLPYHQRNTFQSLCQYGEFVFSYKRNHTNWYAFYDRAGEDFIVRRITNNWNILLPRL